MHKDSCAKHRVHIKTIGCRTNQEEMAALRVRLSREGYLLVDSPEEADVLIVNTCSVTSGTESKTSRMLRNLSSRAPSARILVTGCLAQQKPEQLKSSGIHWVVGNTFKNSIVSILRDECGGVYHSSFEKNGLVCEDDCGEVSQADEFRTRFSIKIQEGCDYSCTYCIVPRLRGPSRSVPGWKILEKCREAVDAGFKEIVLTGTHIGQAGKDEGWTLIELLKKIISIDGDFRVRLSSLDPRDLSDELLQIIGEEPKVCDHLHVSVQSLNADVLVAMKRDGGGLDNLLSKLFSFRQRYPHAGLGGDFIVGFPGETEEMFSSTLENVRLLGFSYGHVFRFSARPQTAAFSMSGKIPESVKSERSASLRRVIDESRGEFLSRCVGVPLRIIVESLEPVSGLTSNYIRVKVPEVNASRNSWLEVLLKKAHNYRYCIAEPFYRKDL
ncbi:MAG TPA: tRNA (N(6)-L-threonylcarbamoyladenosine(37)-C(2))-methylthiotransferase MtaB [Chitinispirillaceae bacterium]|nr:tRNA (N(6)-L-threonylcarbamoyladenosine(37)-C(2))-methylthiotransferase MtaB [Chitinispirillaceae bacterium]